MRSKLLPLELRDVTIRDAAPMDAARVVEMVGALAAHHGDAPRLCLADVMRDAFSAQPWLYLLVAESGGAVIGYAALGARAQFQLGTRGLDVHHVFVEPSERGRGVGTALIEAAKRKGRALGCSYVQVGADPDNLSAQAFYSARGFARRQSYPPSFEAQI